MNLERFIKAQERDHARALAEIRAGHKASHWIWYIFPQIQGLGFSETAKYYAIKSPEEAKAYLAHPVLGQRLREITAALLELPCDDATAVMGHPDDLKLRSSMTLFFFVSGEALFQNVLDKYFGGQQDKNTLRILKEAHPGME